MDLSLCSLTLWGLVLVLFTGPVFGWFLLARLGRWFGIWEETLWVRLAYGLLFGIPAMLILFFIEIRIWLFANETFCVL